MAHKLSNGTILNDLT